MMPNLELELVLLRHGSTQWNAERRYLGHTDLPLLPSSIEQLTQLTEQPDLLGDFWRVYSSDFIRCRETLACIVPEWKDVAIYDNRLREMNFGDWEGLTYEELKGNGIYRNWLDDPKVITPPNGESWGKFEERVDSFLLKLFHAAQVDTATKTDLGEAQGEPQDEAQGEPQDEAQDEPRDEPQEEAQDETQKQAVVPQSIFRKVLIVTHGGVIRQLLARTISGLNFRDAAAPPPGSVMVLKLLWCDGQWVADPTVKNEFTP